MHKITKIKKPLKLQINILTIILITCQILNFWFFVNAQYKIDCYISYQRTERFRITKLIVIPMTIKPVFAIYFLASLGSIKNIKENPHTSNHISFIEAITLKIWVL